MPSERLPLPGPSARFAVMAEVGSQQTIDGVEIAVIDDLVIEIANDGFGVKLARHRAKLERGSEPVQQRPGPAGLFCLANGQKLFNQNGSGAIADIFLWMLVQSDTSDKPHRKRSPGRSRLSPMGGSSRFSIQLLTCPPETFD
jgi:hypothetical protein